MKTLDGKQQAALLYGRAMHGEYPPAIDRKAALAGWSRTWRIILTTLTPLQMQALKNALREHEAGR